MSHFITSEMTRQLMADSLKKLMQDKPLHKISIREITDDCGLNRQTFYYHFQDIYALLEWIVEKEVFSVLEDTDNFLTWQDAGLYLLNYLQQNSVIVLCALNSLGRATIKQLLFKDIMSIATLFISHLASDIKVSEKAISHVARYYAISFGALLEDWLSTGMKIPPKELIEIVDTIASGTAKNALERFAAKETSQGF